MVRRHLRTHCQALFVTWRDRNKLKRFVQLLGEPLHSRTDLLELGDMRMSELEWIATQSNVAFLLLAQSLPSYYVAAQPGRLVSIEETVPYMAARYLGNSMLSRNGTPMELESVLLCNIMARFVRTAKEAFIALRLSHLAGLSREWWEKAEKLRSGMMRFMRSEVDASDEIFRKGNEPDLRELLSNVVDGRVIRRRTSRLFLR